MLYSCTHVAPLGVKGLYVLFYRFIIYVTILFTYALISVRCTNTTVFVQLFGNSELMNVSSCLTLAASRAGSIAAVATPSEPIVSPAEASG